jgi:hypothetical protein
MAVFVFRAEGAFGDAAACCRYGCTLISKTAFWPIEGIFKPRRKQACALPRRRSAPRNEKICGIGGTPALAGPAAPYFSGNYDNFK